MPMSRSGFGDAHAGNSPVGALAVGAATLVPSLTTTTVTSFSATGPQTINRISVNGDVYAKWLLVLTTTGPTVTTIEEKNTGPDRGYDFEWIGGPLIINSGDVLDVKVRHAQTGLTPDFEATIYGV